MEKYIVRLTRNNGWFMEWYSQTEEEAKKIAEDLYERQIFICTIEIFYINGKIKKCFSRYVKTKDLCDITLNKELEKGV